MTRQEPLKQILALTRAQWDTSRERRGVRDSFRKVGECRTAALGAEVYASDLGEKVFFHTCKSRACPSCGNRGTLLWQREQWVTLPDIPFVGIVLTMPDVFWPIFRAHRHLERDLPALGAAVIQQWAWTKHRVRLYVMVIQHTFGGHLNYNPHLHMMVSAGGLESSQSRWTRPVDFNAEEIMSLWRLAVTEYLLSAHISGLLTNSVITDDFEGVIQEQAIRRWNIFVTSAMTKKHFLGYAGRYIRRLPISQRCILSVTAREVAYQSKDTRTKSYVEKRCTPEAFVALLAQHVPDRYRHSMRYFGLLSPRTKCQTQGAVFDLLGQLRRPKLRREPWNISVRRRFKVDPLLDAAGDRMQWVRSNRPQP